MIRDFLKAKSMNIAVRTIMYERLKRLFTGAGHRLYIVGGYVRDRMLGIPPGSDMDLSTDAVPEQVRALLEGAGYGVLDMGLEFGTLTARNCETEEMIEITTFRTGERYYPGSRHPKVTFGTELADDLSRRDFTVNAMALDERGELIDPHGGLDHLRRKLLRTPGDPHVSMREDPLRILRAFRFMATLGFSLGDETALAVRDHASDLAHVAAERKLKEMNLLLAAPGENLPGTLNSMLECGVLLFLLPELKGLAGLRGVPQGRHHSLDPWEHTLQVVRNAPANPLLRWAALFHDAGKAGAHPADSRHEPRFHGHEAKGAELALSAAESMRFSRAWRRSIVFLVRNHMRPVLYNSEWSVGAVRRLANDAGGNLEMLLQLAEADAKSKAPETCLKGLENLNELRLRLERLEERRRLLARGTGKDLSQALGLTGNNLGRAISRLEDAVLANELPPEPDIDLCVRFLGSSVPEGHRQGP